MAGSFADSPRNGAWGDRPYSIIDWNGPTSYTAITPGTVTVGPTGGQAITPAAFGLTAGLEGIFAVSGSASGTYHVIAYQTTAYNKGQPNPTWVLQWITSATGVEVAGATNLSTEVVRLVGFGPY